MILTSQNKKVFLFITDNELFLLSWQKYPSIIKDYDIEQIFASPDTLINNLASKEIGLVIIPDYWMGNEFYPVSSKRASIIEAFLMRKLPLDFPDVPDSKDFFEYIPRKNNGQEGVIVYFIQEQLFYRIYNIICSYTPVGNITTPAFLWQAKFSKQVKGINKGQKLIVHIYSAAGYLCFFSNGIFLFSRVIPLSQEDPAAYLSFEIMQSLRLFSQRVKKDVEKIYVVSEDKEMANYLYTNLDLDVEDVSERIAFFSPPSEIVDKLGSIAFLNRSDISESAKYLSIIQRQERTLRTWSLFQNTGIAVGTIFFLLMLLEVIFLPHLIPLPDIKYSSLSPASIQSYISAIDEVIYHESKIDPSLLVLKVLQSVPENLDIAEIRLNTESMTLGLNGYINASKIEEIERMLSHFTKELKRNLPGAQIPSMEKIDIRNTGDKRFEFQFNFGIIQE